MHLTEHVHSGRGDERTCSDQQNRKAVIAPFIQERKNPTGSRTALATNPGPGYALPMAFELIIHAPEGDIVLGSYETRTAAEKLAAIAVPPGEPWSVIEVDGAPRPAAVIDLASYRAKRRARHQKN
jgi:hypothetical protein